jgi:hypothetical protein
MGKRALPLSRIWNKSRYVVTPTGCWEWSGNKDEYGRGRVGNGIYKNGTSGTILVSRASWILTYGEIPDNIKVCHTCDNPSCYNPEHLFLGTQKDNVDDMWKKNRGKLSLQNLCRKGRPHAPRDLLGRFIG